MASASSPAQPNDSKNSLPVLDDLQLPFMRRFIADKEEESVLVRRWFGSMASLVFVGSAVWASYLTKKAGTWISSLTPELKGIQN